MDGGHGHLVCRVRLNERRRVGRTGLRGRCSVLSWNLRQRYPKLRITGLELARRLGEPKICYLCGRELRLVDAEADHAYPAARSGPAVVDNLRWAHKRCNRMKHDLTVFEFYELARVIGRHLGRTRGCYK